MWHGKWNIKAVLLGALVDVGGSIVAGILFAASAVLGVAVRGGSPDQLVARVTSPEMLALQVILGTGFSLVGGYVAGRIAKAREVQHALAGGILSSLLALAVGTGSVPAWYWVVAYVLVLPAAAMGGVWARSRNRFPASRVV